jgi:hypothetical protein
MGEQSRGEARWVGPCGNAPFPPLARRTVHPVPHTDLGQDVRPSLSAGYVLSVAVLRDQACRVGARTGGVLFPRRRPCASCVATDVAGALRSR